MAGRPRWLTPDEVPDARICRVLHIPDELHLIGAVSGAIALLSDEENWEAFGTATPAECATAFMGMVEGYFSSTGECMPIGTVLWFASLTPPAGWLTCDGSEYLIADYPRLYAVIGDTWGEAEENYFKLPDLRGRVPLGAGSGEGLTPREVADTGGEEAHVLIEAEMPTHAHTAHSHGLDTMTGELVLPSAGVTMPGTLTGYAGGGLSHENMPPFLGLLPIILGC